jgi:hypothetical protein
MPESTPTEKPRCRPRLSQCVDGLPRRQLTRLRVYLDSEGLRLEDVCALAAGKINVPRLSRLAGGVYAPRPEEKALVAQALGVQEERLFDPLAPLPKAEARRERARRFLGSDEGALLIDRLLSAACGRPDED